MLVSIEHFDMPRYRRSFGFFDYHAFAGWFIMDDLGNAVRIGQNELAQFDYYGYSQEH